MQIIRYYEGLTFVIKRTARMVQLGKVVMKLEVILVFFAGALVDATSTSSKIINGELAVEGQFPHMVQLSIRQKDSTRYCGGSLLDSQWVLTVSS